MTKHECLQHQKRSFCIMPHAWYLLSYGGANSICWLWFQSKVEYYHENMAEFRSLQRQLESVVSPESLVIIQNCVDKNVCILFVVSIAGCTYVVPLVFLPLCFALHQEWCSHFTVWRENWWLTSRAVILFLCWQWVAVVQKTSLHASKICLDSKST